MEDEKKVAQDEELKKVNGGWKNTDLSDLPHCPKCNYASYYFEKSHKKIGCDKIEHKYKCDNCGYEWSDVHQW